MDSIQELQMEIEMNLNDFNFDGVIIEDIRKYIIEETEIDNLFCFFMELFTYCQQTEFYFERTREISLLSFIFENIDNIMNDLEMYKDGDSLEQTLSSHSSTLEFSVQASSSTPPLLENNEKKEFFVDIIVYYIVNSGNTHELLDLFSLLTPLYLKVFIKSLNQWVINPVSSMERILSLSSKLLS